jgi:DNA-directed RNA polymerase subunit L
LPNEVAIYELIKEDEGVKAVIYEVEYPSEFSEFISEYYI